MNEERWKELAQKFSERPAMLGKKLAGKDTSDERLVEIVRFVHRAGFSDVFIARVLLGTGIDRGHAARILNHALPAVRWDYATTQRVFEIIDSSDDND